MYSEPKFASESLGLYTGQYGTCIPLFTIYRKIESIEVLAILSIHWCTRQVDGHEIMTNTTNTAPYSMANLLELREREISLAR